MATASYAALFLIACGCAIFNWQLLVKFNP